MSGTVLTYFNMKGRADMINMALELTGEKYEEKRLSMDEWGSVKVAGIESGLLPFGQVPQVHIDDMDLVEAGAIIRYLGRKYNLLPECPKRNAFGDMFYEGIIDFFNKYIILVISPNREEGLKNFYQNEYHMFMRSFERLLGKYEGPFILGEKVSIYDAAAFAVFDQITSGAPSPDEYKAVSAFKKAFSEIPSIKSYLASGRRPAF